MTGTIWTIGYERATLPTVIAALKGAGITMLIDVRELPLSRRAGFSKSTLAASLSEAGIGYRHLKALGTPKAGRQANKARDYARFWSIVDDRLATAEAALALRQAAALAGEAPSALLCFEADPCICHRLRVAELLRDAEGFRIEHLSVAAA